MIALTFPSLAQHAPQPLDYLVECRPEVHALAMGHDRLASVYVDQNLDSALVLFVGVHDVGRSGSRFVLDERLDLRLGAIENRTRDFTVSLGDLDPHVTPSMKN